MINLELIKNTSSDVLYKNHLKEVFETYYKLFGEVCTGCPNKISGYINRIKNYKKPSIMSDDKKQKSEFQLKKGTIIPVRGTSKAYSSANITDEIALKLLRDNPNRKPLFSKLPENIDDLLETKEVPEGEKTLKQHTVKELKALYPDAEGKNKTELIANIEESLKSVEAPETKESEETKEVPEGE